MSWSVLRVIVLVELCTFIDDRILSVYRPDTGMFYTTCICTYTCICLKLMGATFLCINILIRIISPPPTQIRLQQYWYQSKKAIECKNIYLPWFFPFSNPESKDSAFHQKAIQKLNMHICMSSLKWEGELLYIET